MTMPVVDVRYEEQGTEMNSSVKKKGLKFRKLYIQLKDPNYKVSKR